MDEPIYTAADRRNYRSTPCPDCGQRRELRWTNLEEFNGSARYRPNEKCRNRQCSEYRDPTSLNG